MVGITRSKVILGSRDFQTSGLHSNSEGSAIFNQNMTFTRLSLWGGMIPCLAMAFTAIHSLYPFNCSEDFECDKTSHWQENRYQSSSPWMKQNLPMNWDARWPAPSDSKTDYCKSGGVGASWPVWLRHGLQHLAGTSRNQNFPKLVNLDEFRSEHSLSCLPDWMKSFISGRKDSMPHRHDWKQKKIATKSNTDNSQSPPFKRQLSSAMYASFGENWDSYRSQESSAQSCPS